MMLYGTSFLSSGDHRVFDAAADQALDGEEGVLGVGDALALGGLPTRRSPSFVKATIDGVVRAPSAFSMTFGWLAFHDGHARVRGAKVLIPRDFRPTGG
jgi:hypothetical protein